MLAPTPGDNLHLIEGPERESPREIDNRGAVVEEGDHAPSDAKPNTERRGRGAEREPGDTPRDRKGRVQVQARGPTVGAVLSIRRMGKELPAAPRAHVGRR
jgi:hypothetical protein